MKRYLLLAVLAVSALVAGVASAVDFNQAAWFKGLIYAGTSRVALTNAAGNLSTTSGTYSGNVSVGGNVGVTGTLGVTGAATLQSTLTVVGASALSGNVGVTGTLGVTGAVTLQSTVSYSIAATVTAAGSSKTDCTALTKEVNVVSTATSLQGVCLLTASAGMHQRVENATAVAIMVYPLDVGNDTLQVNPMAALAADAGFALGPGGTLDCTAVDGTAWICNARLGVTAAVATAGTNQATGTAMAAVNSGSNVYLTGGDGTKTATLPNEDNPTCIRVFNVSGATPLFGHNSDDDTIAGLAADASVTLSAGASALFCTVNGTAWLAY